MNETRIHLPAVLSGEFGISRSEARRAIAQGGVKVNGVVVTDLDLDLSTVPAGDPVAIELGRTHQQVVDEIKDVLTEQAEVIARETDD